MPKEYPRHYFSNTSEWRAWLEENHSSSDGIALIFYKVSSETPSMRWEEAVRVALCFGWIDSTVQKIDEERRQQIFTPRKPKSVWSKVNKNHITDLISQELMHSAGLESISIAKENGSWTSLDDVENLIIPNDLQIAFDQNKVAFANYQSFARGYQKSYLYWLNQAKREETRQKRISEIVTLCEKNEKSRNNFF